MEALTRNIKKLRLIKGLSQTEFAKIFDLTRANIGSYEEGRALPKMDVVVRMANYFGVTLDDFINTELTVNDLSGFSTIIESNETALPKTTNPTLVSIPYVTSRTLRKYLSLGRSPEQITLPHTFNADLALLHEGHALEGRGGYPSGSVLLLEKARSGEILHGAIHVISHAEGLTTGICLVQDQTVVVRGITSPAPLAQLNRSSCEKVWRVIAAVVPQQQHHEYTLLNDRIEELERTLESILKKK